ncbi:hypothetical protein BRC81_02755 [Halobacteriales archaeon QS_1_68_20]|nr:MAG: hypothetical protein BRC81_02755 [Halobacteriales archaeon QS_1_68_20]
MSDTDPPPELDMVARRIEFLEYLWEEPRQKPEMVDALDNSRSTVDRAIRELEVAGLVERRDGGFATTSTGAAMAESYRDYVREQGSLLEAHELLDVLPPSAPLGREAVVGGDVHLADGPTPYQPLEHVESAVRHAERLRGLVPTLSNPHTVRLCHDRAIEDGMQAELVLGPELYRTIDGSLQAQFAEMAQRGDVTLSVGEQPGFTFLVSEREETTQVVVVVYDDGDALHGVLVNEAENCVRWAEDCFQQVEQEAEEVTDAVRNPSAGAGFGEVPGADGDADESTAEPGDDEAAADGSAETADPVAGNDGRSGPSMGALSGGEADPAEGRRVDELFTVQLEAEGVVRLDESYFASREPAPPAVAWRTGLDLVDVHAGYAVDRERPPGDGHGPEPADGDATTADPVAESAGTADLAGTDGDLADSGAAEDERETLTESLAGRLLDGDDLVVVGPPGAGKSTVCKQVACRWYEADHGPVFYRESGADERFGAVAKLCDQLRNARGTALVVFEDAVREEANAVFEVMRALDGRDDVAFLLDARETEWRNPEEFPVDASLEAYRQAAVETVRVPPLDDVECRRLIDKFEELVDADPEPSAERLLEDVQRDVTVGERPRAGALFLLLHRLSTYANPLASDEEAVTSLDQDVKQVYRSLTEMGDLAVDVGVLVNLLNAADVGIYPEYLHALAGDGEHDRVRDALDRLEGRVVFRRGQEDAYRAVHESWSTHFLAHLLDAEAGPQRRFGRCVSALLSLADDADLRERIDWELQGTTLERIESVPSEWVDEVVDKLFALGRNRPKLAPLFGTTDYSRIELPEACSRETRLRCTAWRGRTYVAAGLVDEAQAEFERLEELVDESGDELDESAATELVVESLQGQSDVARQRGDLDDAEAHARRALELARETGDDRAVARSLRDLGRVAEERGDLDEAEERLTESLETFESLGARQAVAATLADLGSVAEERGDFDEAIEYHEQSLAARRAVGDERGEATCLRRLGAIAAERGEYERAERYHVRSLELARAVGDRRGEATSLNELGTLALNEGAFDDAEAYYERSLELARELDDQEAVLSALGNLGNIANMQGDFEAATSYYDRTLQKAKSTGDKRTQALVHRNLDLLYGRKDELETAEEHARRALQLHREIGNQIGEAEALIDVGRIALRTGDLAEAERRLQRALQITREVGAPRSEAEALEYLGIVAHRRGDLDEAETRLREGVALHRERGHPSGEADSRKRLGIVARDRGRLEDAAEHAQAARDLFEETDNQLGVTNCWTLMGEVALERGDLDEAGAHLTRALERAHNQGYTLSEIRAMRARAALWRARGDLESARTDAERSLELARETGDVFDRANALLELGDVERAASNETAACDHYEAAVDLYRDMGATGRAIEATDRLIRTADSPATAAEWCREGVTMADSSGFDEEREDFEERLERLTAE